MKEGAGVQDAESPGASEVPLTIVSLGSRGQPVMHSKEAFKAMPRMQQGALLKAIFCDVHDGPAVSQLQGFPPTFCRAAA